MRLGSWNSFASPNSGPAPVSLALGLSVFGHDQGRCPERTLCILDFLKTLAKSGAVFKLDTLLVGSNGFVVSASSVQGGAFPRVTFSPRWIESDALEIG